MGLFQYLFRRPRAPRSADELRDQLFDAVERNDEQRLLALSNTWNDLIRVEFPRWCTMPKSFMGDQAKEAWYGKGLVGVADFYRRCGISALIDRLSVDDASNPLVRWRDAYALASTKLDGGQAEEVVEILRPLLGELAASSGSGVDLFHSRCLGLMGSAYHRLGHQARAREYTTSALRMCRELKDVDGAVTYARNLEQIEAG